MCHCDLLLSYTARFPINICKNRVKQKYSEQLRGGRRNLIVFKSQKSVYFFAKCKEEWPRPFRQGGDKKVDRTKIKIVKRGEAKIAKTKKKKTATPKATAREMGS